MSNNNYITIQLSFLSYILFVFIRFEAFVRNAILDVFAVAIRLFRNIFGRAFFKPFFDFPFFELLYIQRKSDYRRYGFGHGESNPRVV